MSSMLALGVQSQPWRLEIHDESNGSFCIGIFAAGRDDRLMLRKNRKPQRKVIEDLGLNAAFRTENTGLETCFNAQGLPELRRF